VTRPDRCRSIEAARPGLVSEEMSHAGSSAGWQLGVPAWERAHRAGRLVRRRTSCIC